MKQRIVFHYLLFLIIIFGAFASMAQNNYGLTIISVACVLFSASLLLELIQKLKTYKLSKILELLGMSTMFILFALRAAYIHFLYVEWLLMLVTSLLVIIYSLNGLDKTRKVGTDNKRVRNLIIAYYLSLVGFSLTILFSMVIPILAEPLGALSTGFLGLFIIGLYLSKTQIINGVEVKTSDYLKNQAGHSVILMTGYMLISLYSGLNMIGVLPSLYTNKLPQSYIELINKAETGKETPIDGVYQYELYKEAYNKFLERENLTE